MAQVPAVSKAHRCQTLLAARLGLNPGKALIASERAALALRAAKQKLSRPDMEEVRFLIPLVGPSQVGDWETVTRRLATTLDGFLRQTDARWTATICCQTRPPLPEDPRIQYLPFDDPTPGNDKWRKLAQLCDDLGTRAGRPAYIMSFDADDLLHRGAVEHMLKTAFSDGYLVQDGYVMDLARGTVARATQRSLKQPLQKPFWKLCGSCIALPHDPELPQSTAFLRAMMQHEHRMFPYLATLAGYRPLALKPASVLYVLNHGENFGARRGRVGFKTRFVERFKITDSRETARIKQDFPDP